MLIDELIHQICEEFGYQPTEAQLRALHTLGCFLADRDQQVVMVMRGSAGTGKTALAGAVVRTLLRLRQKVVLMAPTGRAAKVFALSCKMATPPRTFTIHRRIYRQKSMEGGFNLNYNSLADALFMVDEASMISNDAVSPLLDDLIQFVYQGRNCRLLLIGDSAQLPPVGEHESPALSRMMLEGYGLKVYECDVDEVLRQSQSSGILWNATMIRNMEQEAVMRMPAIRLKGFADIQTVSGNDLIDMLAASYGNVGVDETMIITRSNKRANLFNQGVRNRVLDRDEEINGGDLLMIVKNKYLKAKEGMKASNAGDSLDFLANGDRAVVRRIRNVRALYGFRFADATLRFPDYDDQELTTTILLDTLQAEAPALTDSQQRQLFEAVMEDYADIPRKSDRLQQLKEDIYYNALQVKFGYAVTCHKAQGGQWSHVYIDQGYMTAEMLTPKYYHWLYTAFTRATERLFLVNWKVEEGGQD